MLGRIYRIYSPKDPNHFYIGCTRRKYLSKRLWEHKKNYKNRLEGKHHWNYTVFRVFEKHGIEDVKIEEVDAYEIDTMDELRTIEKVYIETCGAVNSKSYSS